MSLPVPNAKAKPTAQYMSAAIEKFVRIFATTVPAFLPREKPISRKAKPACMNITRQPATITHSELIATESASSPFVVGLQACPPTRRPAAPAITPAASSAPRASLVPLCIRPPRIGRTTEP